MSIVGKGLGVYLGIELINGKLKPKFGKAKYVGLAFFGLFVVLGVFLLWLGIVNGDSVEDILMPIALVASNSYLILISPITVKNVFVMIEEDGVVQVSHKNKEVTVDIVKDSEGKFNFAKPNSKHSCVRYADGSKMSLLNQYRIVNYLADALQTNGLLSEDVKITLE